MPMPEVNIGDQVYWYQHGDLEANPRPAIVTVVNQHGSLHLNVIENDRLNFLCVEGSKHVDDKSAKPDDRVDAGGWETREEGISRQARKRLSQQAAARAAATRPEKIAPPKEKQTAAR